MLVAGVDWMIKCSKFLLYNTLFPKLLSRYSYNHDHIINELTRPMKYIHIKSFVLIMTLILLSHPSTSDSDHSLDFEELQPEQVVVAAAAFPQQPSSPT